MAMNRVMVKGDKFFDSEGRSMILRGVNLGGDCKLPYPYGGTHHPTDFSDHRDVSFVGRPFPLEEADEHLGRLRHWGFNCVRLLTTWEAIEHSGPGEYDRTYLDYLEEVVRLAGVHGLYVMIDFHQDVWSRMTGGSGAPGWTFDAVGLDFRAFHAAGAAHVMQYKYDAAIGGHQEAYPPMSWGANHRLPATGIMWTLFFTGKLFTPDFLIEGENVQDYLQSHYLGAMGAIAERLATMPHVLGFDTLNEPVHGWIGQRLDYRHVAPTPERPTNPRVGLAMSPLDNLVAARGVPVLAPRIVRDAHSGKLSVSGNETVNPDGIPIWLPDRECPFERAGAYSLQNGKVSTMNEDFFVQREGRVVSFQDDAYAPLFDAVAQTIRSHQPDWTIFAEIEPYAAFMGEAFPAAMPPRSVNASHWYDGSMLYTKRFDPEESFDFLTGQPVSGIAAIRDRYTHELARFKTQSTGFSASGAPVFIGEFGIPYDLNEAAAFRAWAAGDRSAGIWKDQEIALSLMYDALDALLLHSAQWNYTATNRNDLAIGDGWNQEDLSIFSSDQRTAPHHPGSGGRAIRGFCRPYVARTQGRLETVSFDWEAALFKALWEADGSIAGFSEVYLPMIWFGDNPVIELTGTAATWQWNKTEQLLSVTAVGRGMVHLTVHNAQGNSRTCQGDAA
jgi:hypothetical protein